MARGRVFFQGIVLTILVLSLAACSTVVGGNKIGERYELKRSLTMPNYWETIVNKDVGQVYGAVLKGVSDLGLRVGMKKVDSLSGVLEGSFADSTSFKVRLSFKAKGTTLIQINAGLTGDKTRSVQLFRAAERHF